MLDLGWSEILLIAVLFAVLMGPKDLPNFMESVGKFVKKVRKFMDDLTDTDSKGSNPYVQEGKTTYPSPNRFLSNPFINPWK